MAAEMPPFLLFYPFLMQDDFLHSLGGKIEFLQLRGGKWFLSSFCTKLVNCGTKSIKFVLNIGIIAQNI